MSTITAVMHRSRHASEEHPVLAIDGVPIEQWLKTRFHDVADEDTINGLVPAQGWLLDDQELEVAWQLLTPESSRELLNPADDASTIVPLLICPDDMDYSCTVIAVEQVVNLDTVTWRRFGMGQHAIGGVISSVRWSMTDQDVEFNKAEFVDACTEFRRLTTDVWGCA